ncbi:MAG TPA: MarR family transcriptional regulator [Polyangiaceae bacterium]|jgi:DNA-binding MarR family transcriptional regulator|nr:MarR family transcriptional regulator [Polyangiaceae bacterium]
MMRRKPVELERAWRTFVTLVMDTRGDYRRNASAATDLPFSRLRALKRVAKAPLTLRALAGSMSTDAPAATVIVNDLEERRLVRRELDPDDRRVKVVSVTAEGKRVLRALASVPDPVPRSFDALDDRDVAELVRVADKLRNF